MRSGWRLKRLTASCRSFPYHPCTHKHSPRPSSTPEEGTARLRYFPRTPCLSRERKLSSTRAWVLPSLHSADGPSHAVRNHLFASCGVQAVRFSTCTAEHASGKTTATVQIESSSFSLPHYSTNIHCPFQGLLPAVGRCAGVR